MRYFVFLVVFFFSIQLICQDLEPCRNDNGLYGYCDANGRTVIPHAYYDALDFIDGHAAVLVEDKWGIINDSGHLLVPPTYDEVINCVNVPDQILVRVDEKWHFVNSYGIQLTNEYEVKAPWFEFELNGQEAHFEESAWFSFIKKGKWGIVDIQDNVKIPFAYEWTRVIHREIAGRTGVVSLILKEKGKYAWQRVDAKAATGFDFDEYLGEYENNLFFKMGNKAVALDAISGARVEGFNRDYFNLIDAEDSVGVVSASGKIIIPFKYEIADIGKVQNYVVFGNRDQLGIADLYGNVLLSPNYTDIKGLSIDPPMIAARNSENQVAVFLLEGEKPEKITDFKYNYAVKDGDQIRISIDNKTGYLSTSGVESWNN